MSADLLQTSERFPESRKPWRALLLTLSLPALGGCAHGLWQAPPTDLAQAAPDRWIDQGAPIETDVSRYWELMNDPVLAQLVELAATRNLDIAQASARVAQARAGLALAKAGYLPQLTGSAGAQRNVGQFIDHDLQFNLGADVSWEADLFGRISAQVAASRADYASAGFSAGDVERLIVGQVALAVVSARASAAQLAIARDTLANQDENLQITRWRRQAGLVSSLDVEQARAQRAQTAATIPALETSLAATSYQISTLIGEPPGRVLGLFSGEASMPVPPDAVGYAAPAQALRRRPDIRAAEATLIGDSARIGVARAQLYPLLQLTGSIGTAPGNLNGLFDLITGGLFAGVTQLIFDGGRTRAQIESAQALAEGSLAAWRQSVLNALQETETAASDLGAGRARVSLFAEAEDAANNAAILARSQYQAGLTDFQTLLNAENQLLTARNARIGAEAERASAFVRLTQALGGGWSPEAHSLPIIEPDAGDGSPP